MKSRVAFPRLPDVPRLTLVDLEIRAVTAFEQRKGAKIDLKNNRITYPDSRTKPFKRELIENLCVDYLRHEWFHEYNKICERKQLSTDEYLELNERFADAVEMSYPTLCFAAQMQLLKKKRKILQPANNAIDRILDDLLHSVGYPKKIRFWKWYGSPGPFNPNRTTPSLDLDIQVLNEIHRAPVEVCRQSESEYVRGCKEWLVTRGMDLKQLFRALAS